MSSLPFSYATAVKSGSIKSESESKVAVRTLTCAEVLVVILYRIQKLVKDNQRDFEVVWEEADGCDEGGEKYWVECEGGWSGRSWDLDQAKHRQMVKQKQKMFLDGIKIGGKVYYLDPVMYRQNWYDPSSIEVKLISEEQHAAYIASVEKLSNVHNKIIDRSMAMERKSTFFMAYEMTTKVRHMLMHAKVSGIADFKEALMVAEIETHGTMQSRSNEYVTITEITPLMDAADRSVLGLTD